MRARCWRRALASASPRPHGHGGEERYALCRWHAQRRDRLATASPSIDVRERPAIFDQNVILIDALMAPTRIYVKSLLPMVRTGKIHAMAHITGGGLLENIPRILPDGLHAHVDADAWQQPRLMAFLQAQGHIEPKEMARTFNCGIGMAVVVAETEVASVTAALETAGETVFRIGHIAAGEKGCTVTGSIETWSAKADWTATHHG